MKDNQKGSALLWAITVIMVLFITIGAALHLSYAYMSRNVQRNNERQAYLSAKGIIEDIVYKVETGNQDFIALFENLGENEETSLTIEVPSSLGMITSNSYIKRLSNEETKGKITIQIEAAYLESTYAVKADMQLGSISGVNTWQLLRYYQVDEKIEPSGNIYVGSTTTGTMKDLSQCWMTPTSSVDQCLLDKVTDEEMANIHEVLPSYKIRKNNDILRTYFYYRQKPYGWEIYDKNEVTNMTLKEKLEDGDYYIQPYFTHSDYETMIVYARTDSKDIIAGSWANVHLIYNDNHWYYLDKVDVSKYINGATGTRAVMMTDFNNDANVPGNLSYEKWARFKATYLIPENMLQ